MGELAGFVESVRMSHLSPPRHPLRQNLENIPELAASISEVGLLHPIVVRVSGSKYEIVAGYRRYSACRRLKWTKVPCQVVEADDKEAFELSLTENIQHETLPPIEMARAFRNYVDSYGYGGESELARRIGRSEQYVSQFLQLLKLPRDIQCDLTTRVVSPSQARELVGLPEVSQRKVVDMMLKGRLSSRQVKTIVTEMKSESGAEPSFSKWPSPGESELRTYRAQRTLGRCLASLKVCMMRFDELIDQTDDDEWILKESLIEHRTSLSRQIDSMIRLRKRMLHTIAMA